MKRVFSLTIGILFGFVVLARAATLLVPTDYPTIQLALDAALDGDEVVVEPGTYFESVVVPARSITLRSQSGSSANTILDGSQISGVALVTFDGDALGTRSIRGFTLRDAADTAVLISARALLGHHVVENCRFIDNGPRVPLVSYGASTDIVDNEFIDNEGFINSPATGGGAILISGSAYVTGNLFRNNRAIPRGRQTLTNGGAIHVVSIVNHQGSTVDIIGNTFERNSCTDYGGAIYLGPSFDARIMDNVFDGNSAEVCAGGFYAIAVTANAVSVERNLFVENDSPRGAGIGIDLCQGIQVRSNTIVGSTRGEGIRVQGSSAITLESNLIAFGEQWGVRWFGEAPTLNCNNAFGNAAGDFTGGVTGTNLSADPFFCSAMSGDYTLAADSPCLPNNNSCAVLIGAFSVGCNAVPTEETTWGQLKHLYSN